jgi:hypothetical protein
MRALATALLITVLVAAAGGNANAKNQVVTKTTEGTVQQICGSSDGCLRCNQNGTCHELTCTGKGGCRIINYPAPKVSQPGGKGVVTRPVSVGNNPGTGGTNVGVSGTKSSGKNH